MGNTTTTIGLFETQDQAQAAINTLIESGFDRGSIRIVNSIDDIRSLRSLPAGDADFYGEFINRNGYLVVVQAPQNRIQQAAEILSSREFSTIDADSLSEQYRQSGYTSARLRDYGEHDVVLPVIEENLQVGKREVERGRMRIYTEVVETPIEEQVTLREERVNVDRRAVDRPVTDADLNAFREGEFEVRATAEEAVVQKQARVVEEVTINKDVTERTETIRDSVRRTDVRVDEDFAANERAVGGTGYETYATGFRSYYDQNLRSSGGTYEQYDPAFRYGYTLANDQNLRGNDWNAFESSARTRWEERNPGTWEQFKDSIRHAWDTVTGKR
ncbi:MAG TPA: YsnF/AvaK domain-containing protein [Herpetosiphonaceae bacterium]|nr:YsnF/AvaK domain-containing protein [Herpetosiphonaceae bacterium]